LFFVNADTFDKKTLTVSYYYCLDIQLICRRNKVFLKQYTSIQHWLNATVQN